jgi:hypothetical protein
MLFLFLRHTTDFIKTTGSQHIRSGALHAQNHLAAHKRFHQNNEQSARPLWRSVTIGVCDTSQPLGACDAQNIDIIDGFVGQNSFPRSQRSGAHYARTYMFFICQNHQSP